MAFLKVLDRNCEGKLSSQVVIPSNKSILKRVGSVVFGKKLRKICLTKLIKKSSDTLSNEIFFIEIGQGVSNNNFPEVFFHAKISFYENRFVSFLTLITL